MGERELLLVLPVPPAHGAVVLGLLGGQPLLYAVNVEAVATLPPHQGTVVTSELTVRTTPAIMPSVRPMLNILN